jgi:IclR family transcriptional regulator, acetate operon repressor
MSDLDTDSDQGGSVRAVERAIDILQAFIGQTDGLKVADIEKKTGIARPTLYRLLKTLEKRRFVRASSDPTRYELDYGVVEIASTWMRSIDLLSRTEPVLQELAQAVGETVALALYREGKRVYVREIASKNPLTFSRGVGTTEVLTRGASGIAILAAEDDSIAATLLAVLPEIEQKRLRGEIAVTRRRGYAISVGSIIPGAAAIAAAIFDRAPRVVGSIGVYGPASRLTPDRFTEVGEAVIACASKISRLLA